MLKTMLKRTALILVLGVLAITGSQSQGSAAFCDIERGLDPLDVLANEVKHNVWVILDRSGSMGGPFDPGDSTSGTCPYNSGEAANSRICIAVGDLLSALSAHDDKFNWGYSFFLNNNRSSSFSYLGNNVNDGSSQSNPFLDCTTGYCGGLVNDIINPPGCQVDNDLNDLEDQIVNVSPFNRGFTPIGLSLKQLAQHVDTNNPASSLYSGQKNYILFLTDGWDTCECRDELDDGMSSVSLMGDDLSSAVTSTWPVPPGSPSSAACDAGDGYDDIEKHAIRAYNSALKGEEAFKILHGNTAPYDGSKGDIFIIGMGLQYDSCFTDSTIFEQFMNHTAWKSSGVDLGRTDAHGAYFARGEDDLSDILDDILSKIAVPTSEVTLGSPIVGSVKELIPLADSTVTGSDLVATSLADTEARVLRVEYRNNILFTTSAETPGFYGHLRAYNIFNVVDPGLPTETREADFTEVWDAGDMLQTRDLVNDPRKIYFSASGSSSTLLDFVESGSGGDLTAAHLGVSAGYLSDYDPLDVGAATAADAAEIVEKTLRGWRLVVTDTYGFYTDGTMTDLNWSQYQEDGVTKTWKLFEAARSAPAVVLNPPRSPDADPPEPVLDYRDFYDEYINRVTTVFLGTNGGMMHAFRGDNGYELYAYIPHDLLTKLPDFVENVIADNNGITNHEYFIASSPIVQDAYLQSAVTGSDEWRTVLAFGRGQGGKFLSALDVTGTGDWTGSTPAYVTGVCGTCLPSDFEDPQLMFTVGNRDGVADNDGFGENYDGLGETWSLPALTRVQSSDSDGQWVVITGSGYGCPGTNEGRYLYVLKLEDGTVYYKSPIIPDNVDGSSGDEGVDQNALVAPPSLFSPHEPGVNDGKDFTTRVYIGDLQGVVHKLDATDPDPDNWEFGVFFEVTDEADEAEAQGDYNQPITARIAVLKLISSDDIYLFLGTGGDSRSNPADSEPFKFVGIQDQHVDSTVLASDASFKGNLLAADGGDFFYDLPADERVYVAPVVARNSSTNGVVFLASSGSEFDTSQCAYGFYSTLFAAAVNGGLGVYDLDPSTAAVDSSMDLGDGKVTGLYHRDEHLYVSKSGGVGTESQTDVLGSDTFPSPMVSAGSIQVLVDGFRMSPF